MMKYFLIYCSILSLAFYSCNKSSPNGEIAVGGEMSLNASVKGVAEVGGTVPDVNLATEGFYMAGYYTIKEFESCLDLLTPNIFNHPRIALAPVPHVTIKDGRYTLPISQHPLRSDSYLSFFAWSQSKTVSGSGVIASTSSKNDEGRPYLAVRVANKPTEQCDIVTSKHMDHLNETVVTAVDLAFNHILSKVTFKLKSSDGSKIFVKGATITYGSGTVLSEGRYGYGSKGELGKFNELQTPHVGSNVALTTATPTLDYNAATPIMLGDMTFIPQTVKDGFMTLNLTYQIYASTDVKGTEITESLPVKGLEMLPNKNYTFTVDIAAHKTEIAKSIVGEWNESINIVDESTILLLDGRDAPVERNGKQVWLDRSGKNNHAEIVTGHASYASSNKGYMITTSNGAEIAFKVSPIGVCTSLTVDIVMQITSKASDSSNVPFYFSTSPDVNANQVRSMFTHVNYQNSGTTFFDAGASTGSDYCRIQGKQDPNIVNKSALYVFHYGDFGTPGARQFIRINGSSDPMAASDATTGSGSYLELPTAKGKLGNIQTVIIGHSMKGIIKYVRIRRNFDITKWDYKSEYEIIKERYNLN